MIRCGPKKGTDQVRASFVVPDEGLYGHLVTVLCAFQRLSPLDLCSVPSC